MAEFLFLLKQEDNEAATRCFQFAKVAQEKLTDCFQEIAPGMHFSGEIQRTTEFESRDSGMLVQTEEGFQPDPMEDDPPFSWRRSKSF